MAALTAASAVAYVLVAVGCALLAGLAFFAAGFVAAGFLRKLP